MTMPSTRVLIVDDNEKTPATTLIELLRFDESRSSAKAPSARLPTPGPIGSMSMSWS